MGCLRGRTDLETGDTRFGTLLGGSQCCSQTSQKLAQNGGLVSLRRRLLGGRVEGFDSMGIIYCFNISHTVQSALKFLFILLFVFAD